MVRPGSRITLFADNLQTRNKTLALFPLAQAASAAVPAIQ